MPKSSRVPYGALATAAGMAAAKLTRSALASKRSKTYTRAPANRLRKYAASKTMLMYKKRQNLRKNRPLPAMGGVGTFSQFKLINRPSKRVTAIKRTAAENFYVFSQAGQMLVKEGYQSASENGHLDFPQLNAIMAQIPPAAGPSSLTKQYIIESCVSEYLLTNSSLATLYVDIYDVVRKRDPGWSARQNDDGAPTANPVAAWSQGVSDEDVLASPDLTAYKNINSLPTDSRLFRDFFRVVKRTHISLAQGSTHRHHVALAPNRLLDNELLSRANGDLKGLTVYTMICAYGQPASIPGTDGQPATVTTAAGALDIVRTSRVKYSWAVDNNVTWFVSDGLSSLAGEQVVSAGAGTIVDNAWA